MTVRADEATLRRPLHGAAGPTGASGTRERPGTDSSGSTQPRSGRSHDVRRPPAAALRGVVLGYHGYQADLAKPRIRLEFPSGTVTLLIGFGERLRLTSTGTTGVPLGSYHSLVSGLRTTPTLGEHSGRLHGIEVNFSPQGAYRLFGMPMRHLREAFVELPEVLGSSARFLSERLREAPSWRDRFALLDEELTTRLLAGPPACPQVGWALQRLGRDPGPDALARIATEIGWGPRHLRTRFGEQVGLSPKAMARVVRLQCMLREFNQGTPGAQVAARCGFTDQAHLGHEFKAMTGLTPSRYVLHRAASAGGSPVDRTPGRITSVLLSP